MSYIVLNVSASGMLSLRHLAAARSTTCKCSTDAHRIRYSAHWRAILI